MSVSRRSLLATAAAAPVVAAMPSAATASTAPAHAAPPITDAAKPFRWYFSGDGGYIFDEEFSSEEQALAYLAREGEGMIAECQKQDFDLSIHADEIFERWMDANEEQIGEGEFFSITDEQEKELSRVLTAVAYAWARKNKLDIEAWSFGAVRNEVKATP